MPENGRESFVPENVRGEIKEKVGKAIDDEELERQGKMDQAKSDAKDAAESAKSGVTDAIEDVKSGAEEAAKKAKDAFKH